MSVLLSLLEVPKDKLKRLRDERDDDDIDHAYRGLHGAPFGKAWHAINFVLTGSTKPAGPLSFLIAGGEQLRGSSEHGFDGGDRLFTPAQTIAIAKAYEKVELLDMAGRLTTEAIDKHTLYSIDSGNPAAQWEMLRGNVLLVGDVLKSCRRLKRGLLVTTHAGAWGF